MCKANSSTFRLFFSQVVLYPCLLCRTFFSISKFLSYVWLCFTYVSTLNVHSFTVLHVVFMYLLLSFLLSPLMKEKILLLHCWSMPRQPLAVLYCLVPHIPHCLNHHTEQVLISRISNNFSSPGKGHQWLLLHVRYSTV